MIAIYNAVSTGYAYKCGQSFITVLIKLSIITNIYLAVSQQQLLVNINTISSTNGAVPDGDFFLIM